MNIMASLETDSKDVNGELLTDGEDIKDGLKSLQTIQQRKSNS